MYGLWFMVYVLHCMVYCWGLGVSEQIQGSTVRGSWFMVHGSWFMVEDVGLMLQGLGFMVEASGFMV